jgi:hypothetical protein
MTEQLMSHKDCLVVAVSQRALPSRDTIVRRLFESASSSWRHTSLIEPQRNITDIASQSMDKHCYTPVRGT